VGILAGELRQRIAIEAQVQTQDPVTGDITTAWTAVVGAESLPANVQPMSAREFIAAQQTQAAVDTKIIIRWRQGITAAMRARDLTTGALYNIHGVLPDNISGREWITLVCSTGLTDGR